MAETDAVAMGGLELRRGDVPGADAISAAHYNREQARARRLDALEVNSKLTLRVHRELDPRRATLKISSDYGYGEKGHLVSPPS